ncbi:hypothetical protein KKF61_07090 [Patescibacteria group bacterium]|nr:hypothetical protein [Patescibacteria group bacterium]
MLSEGIPASIKRRIDDALSKTGKQSKENNAVTIDDIALVLTNQLKVFDKLFASQTLSINQMFNNQAKIQSAEQQSNNKKINDAINKIEVDIKAYKKQTYIYEKNSHRVVSALNILDLRGSGEIEEILIKSQSNDFTIVIDIDDMPQYQRTWAELNEISEDLDGIVAVNRSGTYIIKLSNLFFSNKIKMMISTSGTTFDKIYVRCSYGNT